MRCRLGRPADALTEYDDAARLGPPFPELFHNRGQARADSGDRDGAAADFSYVLDLEPDHLEGRLSLSSLLLEGGDAAGAARIAAEGVELTPDEARLHCALGLALLELDPEQASAAFDRALELDPELTAARVNRAVAEYQRERFHPALDDLTTALAQDPDNPDLLYNRGFVHEALRQWEQAVADYSQALRAEDADRSELLYRRALSLAAAGRPQEADADLRSHLALGGSPYQQEVDALLAQRETVR
ncbi:tetratricopeptide repeat protein [Streptacidiphilus sp. 4-A2]|nr:tetratricopeptide repeat protein [Streptacidiphilus sp. 4-A2]